MRHTVAVAERALIARINRALVKQGGLLKKCRETSPGFFRMGRYYIIDLSHNMILNYDIDLEQQGRELGVLRKYEALAEN